MDQSTSLFDAVSRAREDEVMALVGQQLSAGIPAADILAECNRGMVELGNRFADGDCYLPDLMFAGMIMKSVMSELGPRLDARPPRCGREGPSSWARSNTTSTTSARTS